MSKQCPYCSGELDDAATVCDQCGKELDAAEAAEETMTVLLDQPDEEPEEAVAQAAEIDEMPEEPLDEQTAPIDFSVPRPTPEIGVPEQEKPKKENKKEMALGISLVVCIVLLIAAIVTSAIIIVNLIADKTKADEEKKAPIEMTQESLDAYLNSDYQTYFEHEYYTMFKGKNLDEMVKQMESYDQMISANKEGMSVEVIDAVALPSDAIDSIKKHLSEEGFESVDDIEDIRMAVIKVTSQAHDQIEETPTDTAENDDEKQPKEEESHEEVSVSTLYAVKVDGDWYFTSGF